MHHSACYTRIPSLNILIYRDEQTETQTKVCVCTEHGIFKLLMLKF